MKRSLRPPPRPANRILGALPTEVYERLLPSLERVEMERGDIMYDFDQPIEFAYFPETLISSMVHPLRDGTAVESTTVGNEGVVGFALFLGSDRMAAQEFCQVPGEALRMRSDDFRQATAAGPFHDVVLRYLQAVFTQTAVTAACNGAHNIDQRCARWLLHTHDRVGADDIALTQEFLGHMLGVRRASVNETLARLEAQGCVESGYGRIRIVARANLEALVCECYQVIRREYERLLEGRESPSPFAGLRLQAAGKSVLEPRRQTSQPG